jgi:hypothetical protein
MRMLIKTEMAEYSSWGQANLWQKLGLVCRNRKKSSQIIKDYFPFFLLIILCPKPIISTWGEVGQRVRQRRKTEEEVQEVFVEGEKEKEDVKK